MNRKGITLIELVIFILVGGIFVPLAYIAFTSVVKDSTRPETAGKARFIAEAKMEDITSDNFDCVCISRTINSSGVCQIGASQYDCVVGSSGAYTLVTGDTRFSDVSYNNYQWKWEITDIVYQDNATHMATTVGTPITWTASTVYKVGDYTQPVTPTGNFYRVYFPQWQQNTQYPVNNMVRSTTFNNHYYKSVEPPQWKSGTRYNIGDMTRPIVANGHYYKCVPHASWQPLPYSYTVGGLITEIGNTYRVKSCWNNICSQGVVPPTWPPSGTVWDWGFGGGAIEWEEYTVSNGPPPWPLSGQVIDGGIKWQEDTTLTSGSSQPTWRTDSVPFFDGSVTWQEDTTLTSGSSVPTWRVDNIPFPDGSVSWVRSMVYKMIKVYVRPPGCNSTLCEYIATSMVTGRNYTTRP